MGEKTFKAPSLPQIHSKIRQRILLENIEFEKSLSVVTLTLISG